MKKFLKVLGIIIAALIIIVAGFLIMVQMTNKSALKKEAAKIEQYGEKVKLKDGEMNINITGKGDETIVLLPGFMTTSPVIDFEPLTKELEKNYRVVVVEPLGYGLSSDTNKPRSVENMNDELHQVLAEKGIKKYHLMGHSISGVYALKYIDTYQDEIQSFIGIDSSLPAQGGADENGEAATSFLVDSGLYRFLAKSNSEMLNLPPVSKKEQEQYKYISFAKLGSEAMINEAKEMPKNFEKTQKINYPETLPVLYLLASESVDPDPDWVKIHEAMLKNSKKSDLKVLDGGHYLHHTKAKEINDEVNQFLGHK